MKKDLNSFISKIQNKQQQKQHLIENSIVSMGLVKGLNSKISANELAAKGIKLSIKEDAIKLIKSTSLINDKQLRT